MMNHWTEIPGLKGDVGCTSLATHIAKKLGLLENASVTYIDVPHWLIDYDYFNHAHMLKKGKDRKLVMMYMNYTTEFLLPDGTSVCMQWIRLSLICREGRKHLVGVPLRGSRATHSLDTVETTPFQKVLPSSAT